MNIDQVEDYLQSHGIPDYLYRLDATGSDEVVGIYRGDEWIVYAASRGSQTILFQGLNESQAVERFLYYLSKNTEAYGYPLPLPE